MSLLSVKRRRDIARRKWQYLAVGATVFLGVMMFAASYDAYKNLDASYNGTYDRLGLADATVVGTSAEFAADVSGVPGVSEAATRTQTDIPLRIDDITMIGRFVGMPPDGQPPVNSIDVVAGEYLASTEPDGVVVETHMAEHFGLEPGDTIEYFDGMEWQTATVRGEGISPEYIWPARSSQDVLPTGDEFGVVFASEELMDDLLLPSVVQQTLVLYESEANAEDTDAAVRSLASKDGAASVVVQEDQASNKVLQLDVLGFQQMAVAFPVMFLLAAGMAAYTLFMRLVFSERSIIGTLRANGMSKGAVVRHYLSYGLWIGGIAAILGTVVGMIAGYATTYLYTSELGIPDTIRQLYPITPIVGILFGFGTGLIASWVPARSAAALDPAEAMRGDVPLGRGRRSVIETIVPPLRRAPVRWRMVLRGVARNPRRSLSTVIGVVLALVLVMAAWGMIDTIQIILDEQFEEIQLQDATVLFGGTANGNAPVTVTEDDIEAVAAVDGVDSAERVYVASVSVQGPEDSYSTQVMSFEQGTQMHAFGEASELPDEGVLLGAALEDRLGVEEGDAVTLSFPSLDLDVLVRVSGFVDEPVGTFAYMSHGGFESMLEDEAGADMGIRLAQPDISTAMATYEASADRETVTGSIRDLDAVASATDDQALYLAAQDLMGLFYIFVGMMLAFGGMIAFALIFNTMSVNLAERAGEIATMRANGLTRRQAASLVLGENLLLTLVGIPVGLVIGWWAADTLLATYSSDVFVFELQMYPMTFVWCSLAVIGVTLLSLIPGVRAMGRMDIGTIVRQRST